MFLKRIPSATEYEVLERVDEEGTAVIRVEGPLPGYPPVTVEALPDRAASNRLT